MGAHFLLAKAFHVGSNRWALLTVTREDFPEQGLKQLGNIGACLASIDSRGVSTVLDRIWAPGTVPAWGCLVTTWHEDSLPLARALLLPQEAPPVTSVLAFVRALTDQLRAIHEAGYAHGDISPNNILINQKFEPHIVDFEYLSKDKVVFDEQAFGTEGFSHPARLGSLQQAKHSLHDMRTWDRYALARVFLDVLASAGPLSFNDLTVYNQRALRLVAAMMLDGQNLPSEVALGLPVEFFQAEQLRTLDAVVDALDRLMGQANPELFVPELRWIPENVIEVGTPSPAAFTRRTRKLLDSPEMTQLTTCLQLGLISYIWPTATHTRIEHAIGTYSLASTAVLNLFADPQSPLFRVLATPRMVRTMLAAALLHDVGHYPLAHDLEEAYPTSFEHEDRSIETVISDTNVNRLLAASESDGGWNLVPEDVASVFAGKPIQDSTLSTWTCTLLHSVISGTLDVDKLDYLVRDSKILGVRAGEGIDTRRILSSLTIAVVSDEHGSKSLSLGVRAKGVRPAELVGRIRSHMFGVVYWHHTYRAIKAMIHWIVWKSLRNSRGTVTAISAHATATRFYEQLKGETLFSGFEDVSGVGTFSMPRREGAVLSYLARSSKDRSALDMFNLLGHKRWFKSVLTVEHYENVANAQSGDFEINIWAAVYKLPSKPHEHVMARLKLAERVQQRVIEWFAAHTEPGKLTVVQDWEEIKVQIQIAAGREQLFLVDLVETRKASEKSYKRLYFASAERTGVGVVDASMAIHTRHSYDQARLAVEFLASNGAIRLLCHPDFDEYVTSSLTREDLLTILLEELQALG